MFYLKSQSPYNIKRYLQNMYAFVYKDKYVCIHICTEREKEREREGGEEGIMEYHLHFLK